MLSLSARSLVTGPRSLLLCAYLFNSNSAMSSRRGNTRLQDSSQKRLKVLVDMDQVLCDFEGSFLTAYTETFPGEPYIPVQDRNTFYLSDQYVKLRTDLKVCVLNFVIETEHCTVGQSASHVSHLCARKCSHNDSSK